MRLIKVDPKFDPAINKARPAALHLENYRLPPSKPGAGQMVSIHPFVGLVIATKETLAMCFRACKKPSVTYRHVARHIIRKHAWS